MKRFFSKFNIPDSISQSKLQLNNSGTALIMTILILNIVIAISLAVAGVISSGVKMSGTQVRSAKAYFAAETGIERALWEWRKNSWDIEAVAPGTSDIFSGSLPNGASYSVDRDNTAEVILKSTGEISGLKRTVEIELNF